MKRDELWKAYVKRNPQFGNDDTEISMTARGLRKLFEQTWDMGHKEGFENGKAAGSMSKDKSGGGIFDSIFGR